MVKITLITNNPREVEIVPETMTVREFLERHNVNYGIATTMLDGNPMNSEGLDMAFAEHGVSDRALLSCLPNKDNGVSAIVAGSSCVVKSALAPEQIEKVKKYNPEALIVLDENNEQMFRIDIDREQPGSISMYGACFGNATSTDGKATITVLLDPTADTPADLVFDKIGPALANLDKLERHILSILPEIEQTEEYIHSLITQI